MDDKPPDPPEQSETTPAHGAEDGDGSMPSPDGQPENPQTGNTEGQQDESEQPVERHAEEADADSDDAMPSPEARDELEPVEQQPEPEPGEPQAEPGEPQAEQEPGEPQAEQAPVDAEQPEVSPVDADAEPPESSEVDPTPTDQPDDEPSDDGTPNADTDQSDEGQSEETDDNDDAMPSPEDGDEPEPGEQAEQEPLDADQPEVSPVDADAEPPESSEVDPTKADQDPDNDDANPPPENGDEVEAGPQQDGQEPAPAEQPEAEPEADADADAQAEPDGEQSGPPDWDPERPILIAGKSDARPRAEKPDGTVSGDIDVDADGMVHPPSAEDLNNLDVQGKSTYDSPEHMLDGGLRSGPVRQPEAPLPEGLGIIRDGEEVGGTQPTGHATIYPTRSMPFEEFNNLLGQAKWVNTTTPATRLEKLWGK